MNEDATKNKLKVVSLKFSSISRISLTQTFSFILFLASKRVRVNISAVSCSYNEWFRRRAKDLLFLATFESVMKKSDVGTVFCIMHNLEPAPNGIVRLSPVAELCTNHLVISRHLRRHSGGDLDQRLWPLLSFLMAAVFHPRFCGHCVWQILREE